MNPSIEGCEMCVLEHILRARSSEIRQELRLMNPNTDPLHDRLFNVLVGVDTDLRMLKERADA